LLSGSCGAQRGVKELWAHLQKLVKLRPTIGSILPGLEKSRYRFELCPIIGGEADLRGTALLFRCSASLRQ
jgi:hypothetical protein